MKLVNAGQGRCVEFVLDAGKEEGQVEYRPKVIDMGGAAYPSELRGPMAFRTERTPNFTRYLLQLLYKQEEEQEEEEKEEEGQGEEERSKVTEGEVEGAKEKQEGAGSVAHTAGQ